MNKRNDLLEIESLFMKDKFDGKEFSNLLYKLIFDFGIEEKDKLNMKVLSIIKDAVHFMIQNSVENDMDDEIIRGQLYEAFTTFWKIYATYSLFYTLEGETGYDKNIVKSIFEDRIDFDVADLNDFFSNLASASA